MNTSQPGLEGFVRGLVFAVIGVVLTYVASNIGESGLVSTATGALITGVIGVIEQAIKQTGGGALFGAIR